MVAKPNLEDKILTHPDDPPWSGDNVYVEIMAKTCMNEVALEDPVITTHILGMIGELKGATSYYLNHPEVTCTYDTCSLTAMDKDSLTRPPLSIYTPEKVRLHHRSYKGAMTVTN